MQEAERFRKRLPYLEQFETILPEPGEDSVGKAAQLLVGQELDELHQANPSEALERRVEFLEKEIRLLKKPRTARTRITKSDIVYRKLAAELERESMGKIVAIDPDTESIAGIGETIAEAFAQAKEKTGKLKFSFRRVGSPFIHRLGR